eukprot:m.122361 g.122361  ORF g.122361 m.122361 type:complete len:1121 (+) comp13417_c0_seq1:122-3484(+)
MISAALTVILLISLQVGPFATQAFSVTAPLRTTTTTTTTFPPCPLLSVCRQTNACRHCLDVILPYAPRGDSVAAMVFNEAHFFQALESTNSCSPAATDSLLFSSALGELNFLNRDFYNSECPKVTGFNVDSCQAAIYNCFTEPFCRHCFADILRTRPDLSAATLNSSACRATEPGLLHALALGPVTSNSVCLTFPTCTYTKQRCAASLECATCWAILRRGESRLAARRCASGPAAELLNDLVHWCTTDDVGACEFWHDRCDGDALCGLCLDAMGNGSSISAITAGSGTAACASAFVTEKSIAALEKYFFYCPSSMVSGCAGEVFLCVAQYPICARCLNGTAGPRNTELCSTILADTQSACAECPSSISAINTIVHATSLVGIVSVTMCSLVLVVIFAYGRDKTSMRERILIGLFLANIAYSVANIIPMNRLRTLNAKCGQLALSFSTIRFWRAWWFFGKYGLVSFELFILGASLWSLLRGAPRLSRLSEAGLHLLCAAVAAASFIGFWVRAYSINRAGYNEAAQTEALNEPDSSHIGLDDDLDDLFPTQEAAYRFDSARGQYDALEQRMLQVWVGAASVAMLLLLALQRADVRLRSELRNLVKLAVHAEANDEWADTRRSQWENWRERLGFQKEAYHEVTGPLKPYVLVFGLFIPPAVVMSTTWCQTHSGAQATSFGGSAASAPTITYGTCDVWCEFVLAFRSLVTVLVYFSSVDRRMEVYRVATLVRRVAWRLGGFQLERRATSAQSVINIQLDDLDATAWQISESQIVLVRRLAEGSYGVVWDGLWADKRVAIKMLKSTPVDEDGDVLDDGAQEDFERECAALRKLNHPNLLKFYGFGTCTSTGAGFLVTELLDLGSLRSVLLDSNFEISLKSRVSVALQIALGMEHLHRVPLVHRDLKSGNVLLSRHTSTDVLAKVADFGTSRQFRPSQPTMWYSSFTGKTRVVDHVSGMPVAAAALGSESHLNLSVGIVGGTGVMTKAQGTLLWMAPEVYRGDHNYGPAVDVYSFGIILWELITRSTPWIEDLGDDGSYIVLCARLMNALQSGRRPSIPSLASRENPVYVNLLRQCWKGDPAERPTFLQAVAVLQPLNNNSQEQKSLERSKFSASPLTQPLLEVHD